MPRGADGLAEDAREVAAARQELGNLLARLDARECQGLRRLAIRIALLVGIGAIAVGNGGGDVGGNGSARSRSLRCSVKRRDAIATPRESVSSES